MQEPAKPGADFAADLAHFVQEGHFEKVFEGQVTKTEDGFEVDFTDEAGESAGHADVHFEILEDDSPEHFPAEVPEVADPSVFAKLGDALEWLMGAAFGDVPEEGLPEDISPEEANAMIEKAMDEMPEELRE